MKNIFKTLAFDVYGTLIDTDGVVLELQKIAGDKAQHISRTWRDKQLEYSFRRALMRKYETFEICTINSLDYACRYHNIDLTIEQKYRLLETYKVLPIFTDVEDGLVELKKDNNRLFAFSNADTQTVDNLFISAGIRDYFERIISVDEIKTFKPNPEVYEYFIQQSKSSISNAWLISSNPFDIIGATAYGMKSIWLQRSTHQIFDPWGIEPTITVNTFAELVKKIS